MASLGDNNVPQGSQKGIRDYKVVILGDGGVGKSALVIQFVCHRFLDYHDPTIEDSYQHQARIDGEPARLDILDTAGQPEFTAMREQYMRKGEGFIVCYSITDRRSFDEVLTYVELIKRVSCRQDIPLVIVGNKCDLNSNRKVSPEEGRNLAQQLKCPFFETSAAFRLGVDDVFHEIVREIRSKEKEMQGLKDKKHKKEKLGKLSNLLGKIKIFRKEKITR